MKNLIFLKTHLCSTILVLSTIIVVLWVSLAVLWAFPGNEKELSESTTENVRLPKWAQSAEEMYSPLLFLVYPKEHKLTENTKEQNKWLWMIPTFIIGLCLPSGMLLSDIAVIENYSWMSLISKVVCDAALFVYLLGGAFLLWWAWLF